MIRLFPENATEEQFKTNGIAVLDNGIKSNSVEWTKNGMYSFDFDYFSSAKFSNLIKGDMIVVAPTPLGDQPFRIHKVTEQVGFTKVECYHIFYDLASNLIEDSNFVKSTGKALMARFNAAFQYSTKFRFDSDIDDVANCRMVRMNPVQALLDTSKSNTFINRWGGTIYRDGYDVKMLKAVGEDRGFRINHGKNLTGYDHQIDWEPMATRIMPIGFDGLMLPEKYVDSPLIDKYENVRIKTVDYQDVKAQDANSTLNQDGAVPKEQAYEQLRNLAKEEFEKNDADKPTINIKIQFKNLGDTREYIQFKKLVDIRPFDVVHVHLNDFDIKDSIVSYKFDALTQEYTEIELGTITRTGLSDKANNTEASINDVKDGMDNIQGDLDNTKNDLENSKSELKDIRSDLHDYDAHIDDLTSQIDDNRDNIFNYINRPGNGVIKFSPDRDNPTDMTIESSAGSRFRLNSYGISYDGSGKTAMDSRGYIYADNFIGHSMSSVYMEGGELHGARITGDTSIDLAGDNGNVVSLSSYGVTSSRATLWQIDGVQKMNIVNGGYLMVGGANLWGDGTGKLFVGPTGNASASLRILNQSDL